MKIKFTTIEELYNFLNLVAKVNGNVDVASEDGRHVLDGKSFMGVMSLDLLKPINVICKEDVETEDARNFYEALTKMGIAC